jgi:hypothetical protein
MKFVNWSAIGTITRLNERVTKGIGSSNPVCRLAISEGNAAIARKTTRIKYLMHWAFLYLLSSIFFEAGFFLLLRYPTK